jgi:hypothetical protein
MWATTPPYTVLDGFIIAPTQQKAHVTFPLSDRNLFLSFARLGAHGEPSEANILKWVNEHGLLRGRDELRQSDFAYAVAFGSVLEPRERIEQAPITLSDFRREVRCANQLLRLYADVRSRNYDAIAERFLGLSPPRALEESTIVEKFVERWRSGPVHHSVKWMLDQRMTTRRREGEFLIGDAKAVLYGSLAYTVRDIRLTLTGLRIPGEQGEDTSLARRTMWCPDLLSAIYLQFYLFVTDNKPVRHCENPACGMPVPITRTDRRFCNATCRSNARNYR